LELFYKIFYPPRERVLQDNFGLSKIEKISALLNQKCYFVKSINKKEGNSLAENRVSNLIYEISTCSIDCGKLLSGFVMYNASSISKRNQKSLKNSASLKGIGIFTGSETNVTIRSAPEETGIVFRRTDLPNAPILPALIKYISPSPRHTTLRLDQTEVQTVEHILSAIASYNLDNVIIEIDGPEIPICDGSAHSFAELIEQAGVISQNKTKKVYHLSAPVSWSQNDTHLIALPSETLCVTCVLHSSHNPPSLRSQFFTTQVNTHIYKKELASARTFAVYEEIVPLIEKGYIKGGTLDSAVIIKNNEVLNPEGLRYKDEMVRHKALDLLGDLSLIGFPFIAHIIAIRSGHASHASFAKELLNKFTMEAE